MTLETESILDRRRLRRSVSFWRGAAVLAVALALGAVGLVASGADDDAGGGLLARHQIARVTIEGLITEDRKQLEMLRKIASTPTVDAVVLFVNSPGGTTTGGEALFEAIREVAAKKPVVAQFGTIATSAAYIAGLATDRIFARGNSITGSVGVIFQWAEVSELMGKLGVKMNEVKSGPLKAVPSPFQPLNDAGRQTTERMVAESMGWFRGLVADRRKVDTAAIPGLEQGAIFSGREALTYKLVDAIGGEREVIDWLTGSRGVAKGLAIVDWKPKRANGFGWLGLAGRLAGAIWGGDFGAGGALLGQTVLGEVEALATLGRRGLVSIWQPGER